MSTLRLASDVLDRVTMNSRFLTITLHSLILLSGGCPPTPDHDAGVPFDAGPGAPSGTSIDPCQADWQMAGYDPTALIAPDPTVHAFEMELAAVNAVWVGKKILNDPPSPPRSDARDHRAIVRVDVTTCAESGFWYLAVVSVPLPRGALDPVTEYAQQDPVHARVIGQCVGQIGSQEFKPCDQVISEGKRECIFKNSAAVTHEVVEYDPKCTCVHLNADGEIYLPQ